MEKKWVNVMWFVSHNYVKLLKRVSYLELQSYSLQTVHSNQIRLLLNSILLSAVTERLWVLKKVFANQSSNFWKVNIYENVKKQDKQKHMHNGVEYEITKRTLLILEKQANILVDHNLSPIPYRFTHRYCMLIYTVLRLPIESTLQNIIMTQQHELYKSRI